MKVLAIFLSWFFAIVAVYWVGRRFGMRRRSLERAFEPTGKAPTSPAPGFVDERGALVQWLSLAGFRQPAAAAVFVGVTGLLAVLGGLFVVGFNRSTLVNRVSLMLANAPAAIGDIFRPLVYLTPWLGLFGLVALPWFVVRSARRRRVAEVEQQLPLVLDLLATLSEAGIGFDAALSRILDSQPSDRVLVHEFRTFQAEALGGWPRV